MYKILESKTIKFIYYIVFRPPVINLNNNTYIIELYLLINYYFVHQFKYPLIYDDLLSNIFFRI